MANRAALFVSVAVTEGVPRRGICASRPTSWIAWKRPEKAGLFAETWAVYVHILGAKGTASIEYVFYFFRFLCLRFRGQCTDGGKATMMPKKRAIATPVKND